MSSAKVWNDNKFEHKEKYKDDWITIAPGKYVVMDYSDAIDFKGKFTPIYTDDTGKISPRCYKMIRVEKIEDGADVSDGKLSMEHICQACTEGFESNDELNAHISENHQSILVDQEVAETLQKELAKKRAKPLVKETKHVAQKITA